MAGGPPLPASNGMPRHGLWSVIINFTPSWFAVNMGTGIISTLLHTAPHQFHGQLVISTVMYVLNITIFVLFLLLSIARYTLYPWVWMLMLRDPTQSLFLGAFPMGLATIANATVLIAVPVWGQWATDLAWSLWWVAVVLSVACCCGIPMAMFHLHVHSLEKMTAAWLLPIIPCVVAASAGGLMSTVLPPERALITLLVSYVLWGVGLALSILVMAIYFLRLTVHKLPTSEVIVSAFLPLGPLGQGSFGIIEMAQSGRAVFPAVSFIGVSAAADIIFVGSTLLGLIMWGFGLWWLVHGVSSVCIRIQTHGRLHHNMGFWGFIFPLGVFTSSTIALGPIAVGELFARLAGKLAMGKVTSAAAALLAPHQQGVGVASGAERIVHSLQHTLTNKGRRHALLKLDISNAFNSCDRARALRVLYEQPALSAMWRIADFAYAAPSQLLLQGCDGQHLLSRNGVRQGDALSAVLFCLYLRDTLTEVSEQAHVELHGFFDDINVSGEPAEVVKALHALQRLLPGIGLQLNTAKSHFAYFHDAEAPLQHAVLAALAERNITLHRDWLEVVGSVVGRDEHAIRAGVAATLGNDDGTAAFFQRLQMDELSVQSAMLVLRQCGVPKMNYTLRCMPPPCIEQLATSFDTHVMHAAQRKLLLHPEEAQRRPTVERLRAPLRHGGFGLASARQTSPAAYLGSLAAVACAPTFAPYSNPDSPLPSSTQLYDGSPAASRRSSTRRPSARRCCRRRRQCSSSTRPSSPLLRSTRAQPAGHQLLSQGLSAARDGHEEDGRWAGSSAPDCSVGPQGVDVEDSAAHEPRAGAHGHAVPPGRKAEPRPAASGWSGAGRAARHVPGVR